MIAAGFCGGIGSIEHVHYGSQGDAVAKRVQGFRDEGEVEVLPFLKRAPIAGRRTVRMPDTEESRDRRRGRLLRVRLRRHHAVQERQTDRDTRASQEGSAWNELFGEKH